MRIVGIGSGITEFVRISRMIDRFGERFLTRVYTNKEISHSKTETGNLEYFATLFAAKQAVLKGLGAGWHYGIRWPDLEILTEEAEAYRAVLHGKALEHALRVDADQIHLTISLTRYFASAFALVVASGSKS